MQLQVFQVLRWFSTSCTSTKQLYKPYYVLPVLKSCTHNTVTYVQTTTEKGIAIGELAEKGIAIGEKVLSFGDSTKIKNSSSQIKIKTSQTQQQQHGFQES